VTTVGDAQATAGEATGPGVRLVAHTRFVDPAAFSPDWKPEQDASDSDNLIEAAGRSCYSSWKRPNPATATNAGYIAHILEVGHLSVLEHATATFYLTGVSRSFTHELVRHRHLSYSQLSQRYVADAGALVAPPLLAGDPEAEAILAEHQQATADVYGRLTVRAGQLIPDGVAGTDRRKQAREAARAVLPNATETRIVVTGNLRAWRHFIDMRASEHADAEICQVAVAVLRHLQEVAPAVFADYTVRVTAAGRKVAASPYAERS
jgi:thymidylate synthase (FAD)